MAQWSFLTNHAHVLLCVAADPEIRLRDIAAVVGITERAAHRIVCELIQEGYVSKRRVGRRNCYEVNPDAPLRRPSHREHTVGELLEVLGPEPGARPEPAKKGSPPAAKPAKAPAKAVKGRPAKGPVKSPARPRKAAAAG